ncbi:hypothetical protein CTI14_00035 [Methylobacterium radiotolerans]|nr:hypothetical protein CTI14_00035 [Methylobacterium radiotolerans]
MDEDDRILADRSPEEIAAYLREIGDDDAAARLERQIALPQGQSIEAMLHRTRYLRNGLVVGFVSDSADGEYDIVDARGIEPRPP